MKIDWKKRFKNPLFIAQLGLSMFAPILAYYGLTAQDLTTWKSVGDLIVNAISNPYVVGTIVVSVWNAINNPLSKGFGDQEE